VPSLHNVQKVLKITYSVQKWNKIAETSNYSIFGNCLFLEQSTVIMRVSKSPPQYVWGTSKK
jgi:hypothetical protein